MADSARFSLHRDAPRYVPAVRRFYNDIKVIHFSGPAKPWASRSNLMPAAYPDDLVNRWWAIHDRHMRGLATPGLPATAVVRYYMVLCVKRV